MHMLFYPSTVRQIKIFSKNLSTPFMHAATWDRKVSYVFHSVQSSLLFLCSHFLQWLVTQRTSGLLWKNADWTTRSCLDTKHQ